MLSRLMDLFGQGNSGTVILEDDPTPGLKTMRQSHPPTRGGQQAAVVFVHGYTGTAIETWGLFFELLKETPHLSSWDIYAYGYASTHLPAIPWWKGDPGPERLWRGLKTAMGTSPLSGYDSIAFVAHSMGGLVVQHVLVEDAVLAGRTSHVILFGTPSGGLRKASLGGLFSRQTRGMTRRALRGLRAQWDETFRTSPEGTPAHSFELTVVDGEEDDFVTGSSALKPFHERYRLTTTGDHLSMVKPSDENHRSFRIVADRLGGSVGPRSPIDGARVAVELGEFHRAIALFEENGTAGVARSLDSDALKEYALALDGVGRREDAIRELIKGGKGRTEGDMLGVLGGRYKRRWISGRAADDADRAESLYEQGYGMADGDPDQEYYHAINLAFMRLLRGRSKGDATRWARLATNACGRADENGPARVWRIATLAEAHLVLGDTEAALVGYQAVVEEESDPWRFRSVYHQAMRIAERQNDRTTGRAIRALFDMPYPPL